MSMLYDNENDFFDVGDWQEDDDSLLESYLLSDDTSEEAANLIGNLMAMFNADYLIDDGLKYLSIENSVTQKIFDQSTITEVRRIFTEIKKRRDV